MTNGRIIIIGNSKVVMSWISSRVKTRTYMQATSHHTYITSMDMILALKGEFLRGRKTNQIAGS